MKGPEKQFSLNLQPPQDHESFESMSLEQLRSEYKKLVGVRPPLMADEEEQTYIVEALKDPEAEKTKLLLANMEEDREGLQGGLYQ